MRTRNSLLLGAVAVLVTAMSGVCGTGVSAADDAALYHPSAGWAQSLVGVPNVTSTGAGVSIYVIDDGMNVNLPDFGGRASVAGFTEVDGTGTYQYPNGATAEHATEVAEVAAGATWGVAKQAHIYEVKISACPDQPTEVNCLDAQKVADGINWVAANHQGPSVAVVSLNFFPAVTADPGDVIKNAVNALAAANVFVAVSSGNVDVTNGGTNYNACFNSPADAAGPMVAIASDAGDNDVWNEITPPHPPVTPVDWTASYGGCTDIFAPGQWVDTKGTSGADTIESGTSFSAPFVAGAAALYKSKFGDAPSATIKTWLLQHAATMKSTHNSWLYGNDPTARLSLNGL